jgi:hypothetical protein
MEVSGKLHNLATLPSRKEPQYPLDRRLGVPQSWSGHGGKEKNSCPCWESNSGHPTHSLVTILIELTWLITSKFHIIAVFVIVNILLHVSYIICRYVYDLSPYKVSHSNGFLEMGS